MKSLTLRWKIYVFTFTIVLISMVSSVAFFSISFYQNRLKQSYASMRDLAIQGSDSLETAIRSLNNAAYDTASTDALQRFINNQLSISSLSPSHLSQLVRQMQSQLLFSDAWSNGYIETVTLFIEDKELEITSRRSSLTSTNIQTAAQAKSYAEENDISTSFYLSDSGEPKTLFVKRFFNITFDKSFFIIFQLESEAFTNNVIRHYTNYSCDVTTADGSTLFSSSVEHLGRPLILNPFKQVSSPGLPPIFSVRVDGLAYYYTVNHLPQYDLTLFFSMPHSAITEPIRRSILNYLAIFLISLIAWQIIAMCIVTAYTRAFSDITMRLNDIRQKNYKVNLPSYNDPELRLISTTFNHMADEIESLINKVYRADICLRESEIRLLQSQMNPHFLINLLATLQINCLLRHENETADSLERLSRFLSAQLFNSLGTAFVPLSKELSLLKDYLELQMIRFPNVFQYEIAVEDALLECTIPRLSVQPLVENAIVHGFANVSEGGLIQISARKDNDDLIICITDNGCGFEADQVYDAQDTHQNSNKPRLALRNTDKRLKLLYGDTFGLQIHSKPGEGTIATLRLPIRLGSDSVAIGGA